MSKEPKDVQTWREKVAVVRREVVSSKKQAFQNFLKNLDYRKDTSKVYKFISNLNDKCDINKRETLNSKNSVEYKDKEIAKHSHTFTHLLIIFLNTWKNRKIYMKHTIKEKGRITNQENIFNTDFKPHELTQAVAPLKTRKSLGSNHIRQNSKAFRPSSLLTHSYSFLIIFG
jgi:hypothetical protein